ncbi:hypothetical protein HHI36_004174 [Cryptolaemus montrouzieri]|uniref:Uncharacterized protein n=1 Tax=Cryptolaemus montrouzieri TaxID=559131 RepID=A0ABD2NQF6_9CUCU
MSGEVPKQIQEKWIQDNSNLTIRVDKLTSTNTDLISQPERTEEINNDLKEKLEKVTKQLTMKDELKKTMQTSIEVLTADNKMLGEKLSMKELDRVKNERDPVKIFDITALETRIYERLLVKMIIEITNQMKEHKCPNKEQLKVLGRTRLTSKDFKVAQANGLCFSRNVMDDVHHNPSRTSSGPDIVIFNEAAIQMTRITQSVNNPAGHASKINKNSPPVTKDTPLQSLSVELTHQTTKK